MPTFHFVVEVVRQVHLHSWHTPSIRLHRGVNVRLRNPSIDSTCSRRTDDRLATHFASETRLVPERALDRQRHRRSWFRHRNTTIRLATAMRANDNRGGRTQTRT